jgi:hypothetical protein
LAADSARVVFEVALATLKGIAGGTERVPVATGRDVAVLVTATLVKATADTPRTAIAETEPITRA